MREREGGREADHHMSCHGRDQAAKEQSEEQRKRNALETYLHPEILAALGADDSAFASLGHNTARARLIADGLLLPTANLPFDRQVAHWRVLFGKEAALPWLRRRPHRRSRQMHWLASACVSIISQSAHAKAPGLRPTEELFHHGETAVKLLRQGRAGKLFTASGDSLRLVAGVFFPLAPTTSLNGACVSQVS